VSKNTNGTLHYTPSTGYSGTDSFTYVVSDGKGGTDTGLVTVTIAAAPIPGKWVTIPAGTFTMGSPVEELCRNSDETQHVVTLTNAFEIMTTEVTQGQFSTLLGYNPSYFSSCGQSCPVERVSWHEAVNYCNQLSILAGKTACYSCTGDQSLVSCSATTSEGNIPSCTGYRLPTEAEWEYAYRAGTTTSLYNGDLVACDGTDSTASLISWYQAVSGGTTHPVGQLAPNNRGLYDMPGNVFEWCLDWYQTSLGGNPVQNPIVVSGSNRVIRGTSWEYGVRHSRAANRSYAGPANRSDDVGFRCVRTLFY
jgi:formylglycine-generating enzyme required for sulfatase activity